MLIYNPTIIEDPKVLGVSAWGDIPMILKDIIVRFKLKTDVALEFGVEKGYSTSALANYFKKVIGVDIFEIPDNDLIPDFEDKPEYEEQKLVVQRSLVEFPNIELIRSSWQDYAEQMGKEQYDLIHIDLYHSFEDTYKAGYWALLHSDCVIFHDTLSFPGVMEACELLHEKFNYSFFNYPESCGLGILARNHVG
jgi:predicted O-methyltransferase YrrM